MPGASLSEHLNMAGIFCLRRIWIPNLGFGSALALRLATGPPHQISEDGSWITVAHGLAACARCRKEAMPLSGHPHKLARPLHASWSSLAPKRTQISSERCIIPPCFATVKMCPSVRLSVESVVSLLTSSGPLEHPQTGQVTTLPSLTSDVL